MTFAIRSIWIRVEFLSLHPLTRVLSGRAKGLAASLREQAPALGLPIQSFFSAASFREPPVDRQNQRNRVTEQLATSLREQAPALGFPIQSFFSAASFHEPPVDRQNQRNRVTEQLATSLREQAPALGFPIQSFFSAASFREPSVDRQNQRNRVTEQLAASLREQVPGSKTKSKDEKSLSQKPEFLTQISIKRDFKKNRNTKH